MSYDNVPIRPVPHLSKCKCGCHLPKGSTARFLNPFQPWDCAMCRKVVDNKVTEDRNYYRQLSNEELIIKAKEAKEASELAVVLAERLEEELDGLE